MAARICWNFTKPRPATRTAIAKSAINIRFFMTDTSLSPRSIHVNATFLNQRSGGAGHLGASHPVVGQSGDLIEPRLREIVLPGQHQEVGGEPRGVSVPFRLELDLGCLAAGACRLDSLARGLERGRGIENLGTDRLSHARQI